MVSTKLNYVELWEGMPVVLLHGFPFDYAIWTPQMDDLGDVGRLVTPDLPGFGRSAPLESQASVEAYADAVKELVEDMELGRIVLAGHSMGGYVALAFARRHPYLLAGLVLISTRPGADSETAREGRRKLAEEVKQKGPQATVDAMFAKLLGTSSGGPDREVLEEIVRDTMLRQSEEGIVAALRMMASRPDVTEHLGKIEVPTLILHGTADALIPASEAEGMAGRIPNANYRPIEGAGHMPMLEKPREVNAALRDFVSGLAMPTAQTGETF